MKATLSHILKLLRFHSYMLVRQLFWFTCNGSFLQAVDQRRHADAVQTKLLLRLEPSLVRVLLNAPKHHLYVLSISMVTFEHESVKPPTAQRIKVLTQMLASPRIVTGEWIRVFTHDLFLSKAFFCQCYDRNSKDISEQDAISSDASLTCLINSQYTI